MIMETLKSFIMIGLELVALFVGVSFLMNYLQKYIPYEKIDQYFSGRNKLLGSIFAVVFAFVTPFCSCSTIPLVVNMLQKKLNFGFVMIFLFASPLLDPTILTVMGVILGWKVTIIYTIITTVFSILIGLAIEYMKFDKYVKNVVMTGFSLQNKMDSSFKSAWRETVGLMKTVFPYLFIGALIGSLIHGVVPTEVVSNVFGGDAWWLIPIASVIGIPLYIRLSSMIPISQILVMKGMALGPVMAMLISSAGASLPEVILLKSIFKKPLVITFVASVILMSTVSGFIFYMI
ncbi:permease [Pontibacillus sp. ALD_SL1]|uniref:permease n=1 Tax=Pontibacillus sp. ALD_SL1 TaxID=2777185 RepID=UPI001A95BBD3|nr:permease [Pontibacillus sp. ALD_SL1]QST01011.1 permease [Pontibacillus sp. ALD_SL1]